MDSQPEKKKGNPVGLFAEFWLDILLVIVVGFAFTQCNATSETVVNTCRAIWAAFHALYIALYFRIRFSIDRIQEEQTRLEEQGKLLQLLFSFGIKGLTTLGLHIATGLPQPLLMGGVVTTCIMSPFRRDYANSFIKKYIVGSPQPPSDDSAPPPRPSGARASLQPPGCGQSMRPSQSSRLQTARGPVVMTPHQRPGGMWRRNIRLVRLAPAGRPTAVASLAAAHPHGSIRSWVR